MEEEQKEIVDIVDGEDDDKGKEEMSGDEQGPQKVSLSTGIPLCDE